MRFGEVHLCKSFRFYVLKILIYTILYIPIFLWQVRLNVVINEIIFQSYTCKCQPGYEGKNCDINIDDCADIKTGNTVEKRCKNGAICRDGIASYECICDVGWRGRHCENNINECLEEYPCINGTCSDNLGSYDCKCYPGFCGKNCQRRNPCVSIHYYLYITTSLLSY